ncbi:MAG: hypothetical protein Kow0059_21750 [Candidatus Sumerlaeia bacterium]
MATRQQLQERIAALDAEINAALSRVRVPDVRLRIRAFPSGNWGLAVVLLGWWWFGDMALPRIHLTTQKAAMWLGLAFGVAAVLRTLAWLLRRGRSDLSPEFREAAEHVRRLQNERRNLVRQLKTLKED